jgi:CLU-like protein
LHSAADIEGHVGWDGQRYLIDFARTFPPMEPDPLVPNGHLSQMFRSEFVSKYPKPLCPDAYSGFIADDPKRSGRW